MNIHAGNGDKVVFKYPNNGYPFDQETARKHLKLNAVYTVDRTSIHSCHTDVFLKEVEGVAFNSVLFADYKPRKSGRNKKQREA